MTKQKSNTDILRQIIASTLASSLPQADEDVSMQKLSAWDSMAQVQIVVAIEKQFNVEADASLVEAQSLTEIELALHKLISG